MSHRKDEDIQRNVKCKKKTLKGQTEEEAEKQTEQKWQEIQKRIKSKAGESPMEEAVSSQRPGRDNEVAECSNEQAKGSLKTTEYYLKDQIAS